MKIVDHKTPAESLVEGDAYRKDSGQIRVWRGEVWQSPTAEEAIEFGKLEDGGKGEDEDEDKGGGTDEDAGTPEDGDKPKDAGTQGGGKRGRGGKK